ncbi:TRAP transporter substrate-binding protein [Calderihabitans maritimus]|nr:TRAP transporter substrate-binding protein [Calderihabitans maritimus]
MESEKKIRIGIFWLVCVLVVLSLGGCSSRARDMEQVSKEERIVIRFSHVVAESTPKGRAAKRFALLVNERTNGRVEVQVYPNSRLYKDGEEFKALLEGNVQLIAPATAKLTEWFPEWALFDLPFLFESYEEVHRAMDGEIGRRLSDLLLKRNMMALAMWDNGFKQVSANRPLLWPQDFASLTFRIMPSKVLEAQFAQLGAKTVAMPFNEVYSALESGMVDGAENPPSNMLTKKFYEVQSHLTISNHGYLGYVVLTNRQFWESLPEDIRKVLEDTLREVTQWEREIAAQENEKDLELIKKSGKIQVHYLTEEQKKAWKEALQPVYRQMEEFIGKDLIEMARKL